MIDQNFEELFSHVHPKTIGAIVLKVLSVIHPPLKVDHFKLFVNWNKIVGLIVGFMIDERTRCKIYITHLMIMVHVNDLIHSGIDFNRYSKHY